MADDSTRNECTLPTVTSTQSLQPPNITSSYLDRIYDAHTHAIHSTQNQVT